MTSDSTISEELTPYFVMEEEEILKHMNRLFQRCDSWWTCLGGLSSGVHAPLWRFLADSDYNHLARCKLVIIGLNPNFTGLLPLRELHEQGVLRILQGSDGLFDPNFYAFKSGASLTTVFIMGISGSSSLGQGTMTAVIATAPITHEYSMGAERFLRRCINQARLLSPSELATLEDHRDLIGAKVNHPETHDPKDMGLHLSVSQVGEILTKEFDDHLCNTLRRTMGLRSDSGTISNQMVNTLLDELELQYRDEDIGQWVLTDAGRQHGVRSVIERGNRPMYYLRWKDSVIDLLRIKIEAKTRINRN